MTSFFEEPDIGFYDKLLVLVVMLEEKTYFCKLGIDAAQEGFEF